MSTDSGASQDIEQLSNAVDLEKKSQQNSVKVDIEELSRERETIERQLKLQQMIFDPFRGF